MSDIKVSVGFKTINTSDNFFSKSAIDKAKKGLFTHIFDVSEKKNVLTAKCKPAMKVTGNPYSITLRLDQTRMVVSGHCSCQAGIHGQCKHAASLVYYINNEDIVTCTSIAQKWGQPSSKSSNKKLAKQIAEIFPPPDLSDVDPGCSETISSNLYTRGLYGLPHSVKIRNNILNTSFETPVND
ncbi:hypothetical protein BLOT_008074 [Blomia tropicalis]|nr:hypothetical protein BLOT_016560 [Blomia tropicalis]KAI2803935.1 hypothetical protein BLOT_008074 [Blomia tropicalis]